MHCLRGDANYKLTKPHQIKLKLIQSNFRRSPALEASSLPPDYWICSLEVNICNKTK